MAARSPRRSFASPFVVTLAVVVPGTACYTSNPAPPLRGEGPPGGQVATPAPSEPPPPAPVITNPPRPTPEPAPAPGAATASPGERDRTWTIVMRDGHCKAHVEAPCPPQTRCNPPPPRTYTCPPGMTDRSSVTVTQRAGEDACFVESKPPQCPPGVMCNPPPPQKVDCPQ